MRTQQAQHHQIRFMSRRHILVLFMRGLLKWIGHVTCPRSPWTGVSSKGLTILLFMLAQGSGGLGTTFIQPFLCHHMADWDVHIAPAHVLCSEHTEGRLLGSPAASGQCTETLSSLALEHCTAPYASALAPVPRMTLPLRSR